MKQFKILTDITETLVHLLEDACKEAGFKRVEVSSEIPKSSNIKNKPAISCYLYHIGFAPHYKERNQSLVATETKDGRVVEYYQDAPLYVYAHYILSTFGTTTKEESFLLGLAMKTFVEHPVVTGDELQGEAFYPDDRLNIYPNLDANYSDILSFWRSLNETVRPAAQYFVKCRIESDRHSREVHRVLERKMG